MSISNVCEIVICHYYQYISPIQFLKINTSGQHAVKGSVDGRWLCDTSVLRNSIIKCQSIMGCKR